MEELSILATAILREHYDPIIGKEQNDYMLEKFQSPEAMRQQLKDGYRYYYIVCDGTKAGFTGFYPRDQKMYISKLYVRKDFRRCGLARDSIRFITEQASAEHLPCLFLNVNKFNRESIAAYEHLGFHTAYAEKNPIGCGFYMDDYVMEKPVTVTP